MGIVFNSNKFLIKSVHFKQIWWKKPIFPDTTNRLRVPMWSSLYQNNSNQNSNQYTHTASKQLPQLRDNAHSAHTRTVHCKSNCEWLARCLFDFCCMFWFCFLRIIYIQISAKFKVWNVAAKLPLNSCGKITVILCVHLFKLFDLCRANVITEIQTKTSEQMPE